MKHILIAATALWSTVLAASAHDLREHAFMACNAYDIKISDDGVAFYPMKDMQAVSACIKAARQDWHEKHGQQRPTCTMKLINGKYVPTGTCSG